ncbi:DUF1573 domain-containing protein [Xanthovirga aplysinae]|uniref:DUF1573 domain-containing protein n=1 Tax=Xanthovirga aplysinae TaxID=2529853 RepID=UPI0012BBF6A5|nr:DUF1573 domain-containing protein [Xanthovirga aplysinae]MTI32714.1 DUF1573 domain-containing protein [Xanthovirga aplysinae]
MRKLFVLVLGLFLVTQVIAQEEQKEEDGPKIAFKDSKHDFGDIHQGDVVEYTFKFANEGNEPLVLSNVTTSCGCTATNWPRDPIAPGDGGEITVQFNSAGKMGTQNKFITVVSNATNSRARVSIKSNVLPPKRK